MTANVKCPCNGQHANCDICDGINRDPNVGWFGFFDHVSGRSFRSDAEQKRFHKEQRIDDEKSDSETDNWFYNGESP